MTAIFNEKAGRAIRWASGQCDALEFDVVSESPRAKIYRLVGPAGVNYLKVFPFDANKLVSKAIQISEELRGQVPEVISSQPEEGWILFANHGGRAPYKPYKNARDEWSSVGRCFGLMQAKVAKSTKFLSQFDPVDLACVQQTLMDFLTSPTAPDESASAAVGAAYFIGAEDANKYARLLGTRAHLLTAQLLITSPLPQTLIHGDLRESNFVLRPDGKTVFFNWDDAASGPAGLCLSQLIGSCKLSVSLVVKIAGGMEQESTEGSTLEAYIDALVEGGYSTRSVLLGGLIGSICAGQMRFITNFGRYPGKPQRSESADTIRKCLDDLLDVCDFLANVDDRKVSMSSADEYELCGEWYRAREHLRFQLKQDEEQPELLTRSANLSYKLQEPQDSLEDAQKAFSLAPESTPVLIALARASLGCLDLPASADLVARVLAVEPEHPEAQALLARVQAAVAIREQAAIPQNMPRIAISAAERESNRLEADTLALMVDLFKNYGVIQVDNVFAPDFIARLADFFPTKYGKYYCESDHKDALTIGPKRYMLTIELDELFGSAELIASRLLLPFIHKVLGGKCILNAFAAAVSLPGSVEQRVHKDHLELFEERGGELEPTFTTQLFVPLVALDKVIGTTRYFKSSHTTRRHLSAKMPYQDPSVPLGSCYVSDFAISHAGLGNQSDKVRPILTLAYARTWFRDNLNYTSYEKQPPLKFSKEYFDSAPNAIKNLLKWWNLERRAQEIP